MFQYAFSLVLKSHGETVLADIDLYKRHQFRGGIDMNHGGFELERVFALDIPKATLSQVNKLGTLADTFVHRVMRKFFTKKTHIIEYSSAYNPALLTDSRDLYLEGYFQNPRYFTGNEEKIKKAFSFVLSFNEQSKLLADEIERQKAAGCNMVSVHVRRGDYLNYPALNLCGKEYFDNAIKRMRELCSFSGNMRFVIFSDDIEWCKANLDFGTSRADFVCWNKGADSWQDIALMSKCSHNIIPNSSFSFWGAYLNSNPRKIVIAPEIWNANGFAEVNAPGWITVPVGN